MTVMADERSDSRVRGRSIRSFQGKTEKGPCTNIKELIGLFLEVARRKRKESRKADQNAF